MSKTDAVSDVTPEEKIRANVLIEFGRRGFVVTAGADQDAYVEDAVHALGEFDADVIREAVKRALWTWKGVKVYPKVGILRKKALEIMKERDAEAEEAKAKALMEKRKAKLRRKYAERAEAPRKFVASQSFDQMMDTLVWVEGHFGPARAAQAWDAVARAFPDQCAQDHARCAKYGFGGGDAA